MVRFGFFRGAYNAFLIERVRHIAGPMMQILVPQKQVVDFKEALIFALLGVLRMENANNCLASVTGASRDHCSGDVYQ